MRKLFFVLPLLLLYQNCSQGFGVFQLQSVILSSSSPGGGAAPATLPVAPNLYVPTWQHPFSAQSPWNALPSNVVFAPDVVPKSSYFPIVAEGSLSLGVDVALESDPPMTVYGPDANTWIYIADAEVAVPSITIPHAPASVVLASGDDGHADIVDVANNRIHSFYRLRNDNGTWRSSQYTWTALDGSGWGTPGQYFQGSRAVGVVPMAGLIRKNEVNDGNDSYDHALAMSMTYNALTANPGYTFPATSADGHAASTNYGVFPEGSLMMLPQDFDLTQIHDAKLLKVAKTLMKHGAYVVDENDGTPYAIYVEIGSGFSLMPNGWDNEIASELDLLRASIRRVVQVGQWTDANGATFTPTQKLNLLSMRGGWFVTQGNDPGVFDSWQQAVIFPDNGIYTAQVNGSNRSMPQIAWAIPQAGQTFQLKVSGAGGATLEFVVVDGGGTRIYDSGNLAAGTVVNFQWPANSAATYLYANSGVQGGGKISATLIRQ